MVTVTPKANSVNEVQARALDRAKFGLSSRNYAAIFSGFAAKGIAESDIIPRENIFTYAAWKAQGRQVCRGEKGVKVFTFIPIKVKDKIDGSTKMVTRPRNTSVFHFSQTKGV